MTTTPLFDRIVWRDPVGRGPLEPIISARTPAGVPICGAMRVAGTTTGYPIVDSVVRLTPALAREHGQWLEPFGLSPAATAENAFQPEESVESFAFQWSWIGDMRSEADLRMRVAERFGLEPSYFAGKTILDAGAGAGDQSRFLIDQGAEVLSLDLSGAIDVVAAKLRLRPSWVGVQGDLTMLPIADEQFDVVYCEGVIQHTRDSVATVRELVRVTKPGGIVLATHYTRPRPATIAQRMKRRVTLGYYDFLRGRLSAMNQFKRLLITGNLAALAYLPVIRRLIRATGTALYYDLMPDFKTTWTNTYDYYGGHTFQRFITPEEFAAYFEHAGGVDLERSQGAVVLARRRVTA
jgi:ubiquinone/menaquinone biosynthesis C-methylase UbiE